MNTSSLLWIVPLVVFAVLYLLRRKSRMSREDMD
jgi:hypothetical protein